MKIALIGASGNIGSRVLYEAIRRGHKVTGIIRNTSRLELQNSLLQILPVDIFDTDELAGTIKGCDIVISAYAPGIEKPEMLTEAAKSLIAAAKKAGVKRVIAVSGAGSLEVAPGVRLMDTPEFPAVWKPLSLAHKEALEFFRKEKELEWTCISPSAVIEPGEKTGKFRRAENTLVKDEQGVSRISFEDFAAAILDEAENPQYIRKRFTAGY